jgi:hypothetical protein
LRCRESSEREEGEREEGERERKHSRERRRLKIWLAGARGALGFGGHGPLVGRLD